MTKKFRIALNIARKTAAPLAQPAPDRAEADGDHDDAEAEVDPAPHGWIEVEDVVLGDDEELVVEERRQPCDGLKDAEQDQHDRGEGDALAGPAGKLVEIVVRRVGLLRHGTLLSPCGCAPVGACRDPISYPMTCQAAQSASWR